MRKDKELYIIDITLIPKELTNNNDNFVYLFSMKASKNSPQASPYPRVPGKL